LQQAKHIFFSFICWLILTPSFSQQIYFNKTWGNPAPFFDSQEQIKKIDNYYYAAATSSQNWIGNTKLFKYDSVGNIIKSFTLQLQNTALYNRGHTLSTDRKKIYMVLDSFPANSSGKSIAPCIYKTNTNLDSLAFYSFPNSYNRQRVALTSIFKNGHIYIAGVDTIGLNNYAGMLMKVDTAGNLKWVKHYYGASYTEHIIISIDTTIDNGFVMGLYYNKDWRYNHDDAKVIKVDSSGNEEWNKVYSTPWKDKSARVLGTSDGNILVAVSLAENGNTNDHQQRINFFKYNLSGQLLWQKQMGFIGREPMDVYDLLEEGNGSHSALVYDGYNNSHLYKLKSNGDSIGISSFGSYNNRYFNNRQVGTGFTMTKTEDNGYMVGGFINPHPAVGLNHYDNWLVRLDSNGCNLDNPPHSVVLTPIPAQGGKTYIKVEWQDSSNDPKRKYSVERIPFAGFKFYWKVNTNGLCETKSYIDTFFYTGDLDGDVNYRVRAYDTINNTMTCASLPATINTTYINELAKFPIEANVFPNPAKEYFYLEVLNPDEVSITMSIHNVLGEKLQSSQFSTSYLKEKINVSDLPPGVYIISLKSQNGDLLKQSKIVVQ
jgi:hypothetical protein